MKQEEFLEKLWEKNKHYRDGKFEIISIIDKCKVIAKNKYGECLSSIYDLIGGYNISIETAIDKESYFLEVLKEKNPIIYEQVKMVSGYTNSLTKIIWSTTFGIVHIVPSDILTMKNIRISSAVNKKDYFLAELKNRRKDFDNIDYSNLIFKNYNEKGIFRCKLHNVEYEQSLSSHKRGYQGCIKCAKNVTFYCDETIDYFKESYGKFYIVKLYNEDESFYKVGITGAKNNRRKKI
jgi:hypothetical protein